MTPRAFCEFAIRLDQRPFSLADRPHFWDIYASQAKNLVVRASRQCEKSTFLVNRIIYDAVQSPGIKILLVSPRKEQGDLFSRDRLQPMILNSPVVRQVLWPYENRRMPIENITFQNGSRVYFRSAFHDANSVRGISADELFIDEYQDVAHGELGVIQETISHSQNARTVLVGTPKLADNPLESAFNQSTANEWRVTCEKCGHLVLLDERAIGTRSFICPSCAAPINPSQGRWVPRNPQATLGDGFWINHTMLCWLNIHDVLARKASYDPIRFQNEVLGLPVTLGDHMVTRDELEACCNKLAMPTSREQVPAPFRNSLVAGIDWGGGSTSATAVVIGYLTSNDLIFHVCLFRRWLPGVEPLLLREQVADLCKLFHVRLIAADGAGNGAVYNRLLCEDLQKRVPIYGIHYSTTDQDPVRDGLLTRWTINRTGSISTMLTKIKAKIFRFPISTECGTFLDEFAGLLAEHDDYNRSIKYTHTPGQYDDAVHACNYAHAVALRTVHAHH
jgi:hypothetical protein